MEGEKAHKRDGMTFVGELPPGDWCLSSLENGAILAACPQHPARVYKRNSAGEFVYFEFGLGTN